MKFIDIISRMQRDIQANPGNISGLVQIAIISCLTNSGFDVHWLYLHHCWMKYHIGLSTTPIGTYLHYSMNQLQVKHQVNIEVSAQAEVDDFIDCLPNFAFQASA